MARPGASLAMHTWMHGRTRAVVFYVHGTQSHAGWLFETGPALADLGCAVHAVDRRGSGVSEGARGDVTSYRIWCDDYAAALIDVRARHPGLPLLVVGQSFGGALAAALACEQPTSCDALLVCAPLLVPSRAGEQHRGATGDTPTPVALPDDWYTTEQPYLSLIAQDPLMVRALAPRFRAAHVALTDWLAGLDAPLADKPAALVLPQKDRIVDLPDARAAFGRLTGDRGIVIELPAHDHYLEFSTARDTLWRIEAAFAHTAGFRSAPR